MRRPPLGPTFFLTLAVTFVYGCGKDETKLTQQGGALHPLPAKAKAAAASEKELEISEKNAALLGHLGDYADLEVLSIVCIENLQSLPNSIGRLTKLKELRMNNGNGCSMNPVLPESIGNLRSLEKLDLYGGQDPRNPGPQPGERHKFPRSMSQLKSLTYLDLGRNGLDEIPSFVKDLPQLRELRFEFNMGLKQIPDFLSELPELKTLRLNSNGLDDLPDLLNRAPKLTEISLGDNCEITQNPTRMKALQARFPKIHFDFEDEYECPEK
jgi:Leucine-rich repeat (LRR) protein